MAAHNMNMDRLIKFEIETEELTVSYANENNPRNKCVIEKEDTHGVFNAIPEPPPGEKLQWNVCEEVCNVEFSVPLGWLFEAPVESRLYELTKLDWRNTFNPVKLPIKVRRYKSKYDPPILTVLRYCHFKIPDKFMNSQFIEDRDYWKLIFQEAEYQIVPNLSRLAYSMIEKLKK